MYLVHHIDRDRTNNADDNLMSMCIKCHETLHHEAGERYGH